MASRSRNGITERLPRISNLESQGEEIIAGAKKKNPTAQRIIKAMEKPPYVTHEDIESLLQVIKEAKQPTRFESPFELSSKIR